MDKQDKQKKGAYDPKHLSDSDSLLFYGKSLLEDLQAETLNLKHGRTRRTVSGEGGVMEQLNASKEKNCWQKFVIDPKNKWKAYFDNFVLLLVIYSTITTAYYVSFGEDAHGL
jgi:hypothetical protein